MIQQNKIPKPKSLVIAQIDKIEGYGAYCKLIEFDNTEAFIPLKEVSTGWIKNIHEFLHKGRTIVCRVIYIDSQKGTIDISLKRVTSKDSKDKISEYNLEKRICSLFEQAIKKSDLLKQKSTLTKTVLSEFETYINFHKNMIENTTQFKKSTLPKLLKLTYTEITKANQKRKKYIVSYTIKIINYNTEKGINEIKDTLAEITKKEINIKYLGAPKYTFSTTGSDYVDAEKKIKKAIIILKSNIKNGVIEVTKNKNKNEKTNILEMI